MGGHDVDEKTKLSCVLICKIVLNMILRVKAFKVLSSLNAFLTVKSSACSI